MPVNSSKSFQHPVLSSQQSAFPPSLSKLSRYRSVERSIIRLAFFFESNRASLERIQDIAEVQLGERADRLVRHIRRRLDSKAV